MSEVVFFSMPHAKILRVRPLPKSSDLPWQQEECLKSLEEVKYQQGDVAGAYHSYSEMLSMKPSLGLKAANKKCRVVSEEGRDDVKRNGDKKWEFSLFSNGVWVKEFFHQKMGYELSRNLWPDLFDWFQRLLIICSCQYPVVPICFGV